MRTTIALVASLLTASAAGAQEAWKGYNKGIAWEDSAELAMSRAAVEGKPILFHQLVGDMNKVGC